MVATQIKAYATLEDNLWIIYTTDPSAVTQASKRSEIEATVLDLVSLLTERPESDFSVSVEYVSLKDWYRIAGLDD